MNHEKYWNMLRRHSCASTLFIHNHKICWLWFSEIKVSVSYIQGDAIKMGSVSLTLFTIDTPYLTLMEYLEIRFNLFGVEKTLLC